MTLSPLSNDWSLAVLVGGKGRRLGGRAKGNLRLNGVTLLDHALALAGHFHEALLVGDDAGAYPNAAARRVPDVIADAGAPAGLLSALAAAQTPWVLVMTCDMPAMSIDAAQFLCAARVPGCDAVCFVDGSGALQPFPGLYRAGAASSLEKKLARGISVYALLETLTVQRVVLPDAAWAKDALRNVNTWDDARALGVE